MKKLIIVLFIIFIFVLISCEKPAINETTNLTDDLIIEPTTEETQIDETTQENEVLSHIDLSFLIELDWPEDEEDEFEAEFKVFPLLEYRNAHYWSGITGNTIFLDEQLKSFELPFQPVGWIYIYSNFYDYNNRKPIAYALKIDHGSWEHDEIGRDYSTGKYILMLADGTIPRSSNGDYLNILWGRYNSEWIVNNDYAVITYGENGLGIYDIKNQKEILPCVYDSINLVDSIFYIVNDGYGYLYDKTGKELYSFGELTENEFQYGFEEFLNYSKGIYALRCNTFNGWSSSYTYFMNFENRLFYKNSEMNLIIDNEYNSHLTAWGDYVVFSVNKTEYICVANRNGDILLRKDGYSSYEFADGYLILNKGYGNRTWYSTDESGNIIEIDGIEGYKFYTYPQDKPRTFDYNGRRYQYHYYFLSDENGNILLHTDNIGGQLRLSQNGNFIINDFWDFGEYTSTHDIYTPDGKLLIENLYGVVYSIAPGGGIFVYTTPEDCMILYPDGKTVPIPEAPKVEKHISAL